MKLYYDKKIFKNYGQLVDDSMLFIERDGVMYSFDFSLIVHDILSSKTSYCLYTDFDGYWAFEEKNELYIGDKREEAIEEISNNVLEVTEDEIIESIKNRLIYVLLDNDNCTVKGLKDMIGEDTLRDRCSKISLDNDDLTISDIKNIIGDDIIKEYRVDALDRLV